MVTLKYAARFLVQTKRANSKVFISSMYQFLILNIMLKRTLTHKEYFYCYFFFLIWTL